jgi:hypothetical protein
MPEPQAEHEWLQRLVGEWTFETEPMKGPDGTEAKHRGTDRVRPLGRYWVIGEGEGDMPGGGTAELRMTLGYDVEKKRFVGTWVGSMMPHLWVYDGELDAGRKILTLNADGPSMAGDGSMAKYQDIIEFRSDDHRLLRSQVLQKDGTWNHFMTAHYRRKK